MFATTLAAANEIAANDPVQIPLFLRSDGASIHDLPNDIAKCKGQLKEIIPKIEYVKRTRDLERRVQRPIKIMPYDMWVYFVANGTDAAFLESLEPQYREYVDNRASEVVGRYVLTEKNAKLPLLVLRDMEDESGQLIPVIPGDTVSFDHWRMFEPDVWGMEYLLGRAGILWTRDGFHTERVDTRNEFLFKYLRRRYGRYHDGFAENRALHTQIPGNAEEIKILVEQYRIPFIEYWKSRRVSVKVDSDNLAFYGYPETNVIAIHVVQKDGAAGIGVFTEGYSPDGGKELFWDYSRRTPGSRIGSNILYSAYLYARKFEYDWLNLGFGHEWKRSWTRCSRYESPRAKYPGLRFSQDSPLLRHIQKGTFSS